MGATDGVTTILVTGDSRSGGSSMKQKPINQQVVVVVGASSGIGRATALELSARGATVVVAARNEKGLNEVVEAIKRRGGQATAVTADVAYVEQVKHVADVAVAEYGRIDTWVHASAVYAVARFEDMRPNEMERMIEVNLLGQMYGALAALPYMRKIGRGTLIHVGSVESQVALPLSGIYAASKHGMKGFIDALRLEIEREGLPIAVVNVMPSAIDTPIFDNALTRVGVKPRGTPPIYAPEIVARVIADAAVRPQPEIVVGGGGAMLIALQRFAPRVAHALLLGPLGFESQLTREPRSPDAPNNLFTPTADRNLRIHGDHPAGELTTSLYTRLETSGLGRALRLATQPIVRVIARAIGAAWGMRFRRQLEGEAPVTAVTVTEPERPKPVVTGQVAARAGKPRVRRIAQGATRGRGAKGKAQGTPRARARKAQSKR